MLISRQDDYNYPDLWARDNSVILAGQLRYCRFMWMILRNVKYGSGGWGFSYHHHQNTWAPRWPVGQYPKCYKTHFITPQDVYSVFRRAPGKDLASHGQKCTVGANILATYWSVYNELSRPTAQSIRMLALASPLCQTVEFIWAERIPPPSTK